MSQEQESPPANRAEIAELRTDTNRPQEKKGAEEGTSVMQSDRDLRLAHITPEQIQDANKMIDYAVRHGLELPPDVLRDIALAKNQFATGQINPEVGSDFITASAKLARAISPAT